MKIKIQAKCENCGLVDIHEINTNGKYNGKYWRRQIIREELANLRSIRFEDKDDTEIYLRELMHRTMDKCEKQLLETIKQ